MGLSTSPKKALGVFSLAMITAGSVDSIRNLPATALFGSSLIFFFLLGAIFFLIPSALVSAELASTSCDHGGVYSWVKNAFGLRTGFLAIWFQWIENVIWYPTILSFVAGTIGYLLAPQLAESKIFLITIILASFWGMTIINLFGMKASAHLSNFCAIAGLLVPMSLIIGLGAVWVFSGETLQVHLASKHIIPHIAHGGLWVSLTGIMLSFCGMEIATVHAQDVRNPQKAYPRAMLIASLIILITLLCGSLAIAIVLPAAKISLVSGIMQAFQAFFVSYHMQWVLPLIAVMLVIGGIGSVNNWIIAPTRGLALAIKDNNISVRMSRENRFGAPAFLLVSQAVISSVISLVFLMMPSVNGSYWLLTVLASQLYMMMYLLMFASGIRLRYKKSGKQPGFTIPGGNWGMWLIASMGLIGTTITFVVGFIPPDNINVGGAWHYEVLLIIGLVVMSAPPFIMYAASKRKARRQAITVEQALS